MNWFLDVFKYKYVDFKGRARRTEYWMFMLFHLLIIFVLAFLSVILEDVGMSQIGLFLLVVYVLMSFLPALALTVRRLHDTGRSGWYYLLSFIPYVGGIIIFVFTVMDSENGTNNWGPNPKLANTDEINDIGKPLDF
ncbi:DUF805 domain-containing protein [uncultured Gelidibacter sp.]|uniref:DUF805 domain-containing protein n=1 Tax=uncultured Gelidibacter sp. TaxID=259318 RepID=UPI002615A8D2|nr:DUF805 domain-containing protein [uncultured Gelidibacter sp.]